MATTGAINGKNFLVYVNGTAIGMSKTCKISAAHETRDTTTKDDNGWKTLGEGGRSWKCDADGFVSFDATYGSDELTALVIDRTLVGISFETNVSGDTRYYGNGYAVSFDIDAPNQETTTYTISFEGTGALGKVSHT